MTTIREAVILGWTINTGTLQAKGLFNASRNGAATDDDITVWCGSREEAAKEAIRMTTEQRGKWAVFKKHKRVGKLYVHKEQANIEAVEKGLAVVIKGQRWLAEYVEIRQV